MARSNSAYHQESLKIAFVYLRKLERRPLRAAFFTKTMERKMLFSSASFQRLWGASIGEANRLKCLKRRPGGLAFGMLQLDFCWL